MGLDQHHADAHRAVRPDPQGQIRRAFLAAFRRGELRVRHAVGDAHAVCRRLLRQPPHRRFRRERRLRGAVGQSRHDGDDLHHARSALLGHARRPGPGLRHGRLAPCLRRHRSGHHLHAGRERSVYDDGRTDCRRRARHGSRDRSAGVGQGVARRVLPGPVRRGLQRPPLRGEAQRAVLKAARPRLSVQ